MQKKLFKREISTTIKNAQLVKERREQIFETAVKIIRKKGYHNTTLRDISKESGISLGNLYDYIRTKEDILYLIHEKAAAIISPLGTTRQKNRGNYWKELKELVVKEIETIDQYQGLVLSIYQESHVLSKLSIRHIMEAEEEHMKHYIDILREGMKAGQFKRGNPVVIANLIKIMIDGWVLRRWTLRKRVSLDEMKKAIIKIIEQGIHKQDQKKVCKQETGGY